MKDLLKSKDFKDYSLLLLFWVVVLLIISNVENLYFSLPMLFVPLVLTIFGLASYYVFFRNKEKTGLKFSSMFMMVISLKLFASLIYFVVSYLQLDKIHRISFLIFFVVCFFVYLVFDTKKLLQIFKQN